MVQSAMDSGEDRPVPATEVEAPPKTEAKPVEDPPFLRPREKPEKEKDEINDDELPEADEEENEEEEEEQKEEEQILERGKLCFIRVKLNDLRAENCQRITINSSLFDERSTAFMNGYKIYPYQQTPGPVTGFWNIVVAAPSGKGKTTYLRDLALLNLHLNPDRKIIFISSKQDTSSFVDSNYARDPDCIKGELTLDPDDVDETTEKLIIVRNGLDGNLEQIKGMKANLPKNIQNRYKNAMVFVDDLEESDEAYEDLCDIRNIFIKMGRQYGISVAHACHLTAGHENRDMRNEGQAFVVNFEHGSFVPAAGNFLEHKIQLKRKQIGRLRHLIKDPVEGKDPPLKAGWAVVCINYNVVIAASRIISLGHIMDEDRDKDKQPLSKKAKPNEEVSEESEVTEGEEEEEEEETAEEPEALDPPPPTLPEGKRKLFPHEQIHSKPRAKKNEVWICPECGELCRGTGGYNLHRRRRHKGSTISSRDVKRIMLE
jgi:hypothetical protein